jgi:hypothetical protein
MTKPTTTNPARPSSVWDAIADMRVQFWTCIVPEHRTVEWRGDVAHCTAPGCEVTSEHTRALVQLARVTAPQHAPDAVVIPADAVEWQWGCDRGNRVITPTGESSARFTAAQNGLPVVTRAVGPWVSAPAEVLPPDPLVYAAGVCDVVQRPIRASVLAGGTRPEVGKRIELPCPLDSRHHHDFVVVTLAEYEGDQGQADTDA